MADEQNDGAVLNGAASPSEFAVFRIGGCDIKVAALTLWDLEESSDDIRGMNADMPWTKFASSIVRIIARKTKPGVWEPYAESLLKSCSGNEARNLVTSFNELWQVSGLMGEAEAAQEATTVQAGTGTLTESPPNSL